MAAQDGCGWGLAIQRAMATAPSSAPMDVHNHLERKRCCLIGIRCTAVPDFRLTQLADSRS